VREQPSPCACGATDHASGTACYLQSPYDSCVSLTRSTSTPSAWDGGHGAPITGSFFGGRAAGVGKDAAILEDDEGGDDKQWAHGETACHRDEQSPNGDARNEEAVYRKWSLMAGRGGDSPVSGTSVMGRDSPLAQKPGFLVGKEGFLARREALLGSSFLKREKKLKRHSLSDTNLMLKMTEFEQIRNMEV
jgi:hypothetical protein